MTEVIQKPKEHYVSTASTSQVINYGYTYSQKCKFATKHGNQYAATWLNNFVDNLRLKDAYIMGRKHSKKGCTRISDGYHIQTQYHTSFDSLYSKCFKHKKEFRFAQQIVEVPPEQYDRMAKAFEEHGVSLRQLQRGSATLKDTSTLRKFFSFRSIYYDLIEGILTEIAPCFFHGTIIFVQYKYIRKNTNQEACIKALEKVSKSFCIRTVSNLIAQRLSRLNLKLLHSTVKIFGVNLFMSKETCKHYLKAFRPRHAHFKHVRSEVAKIMTGQLLYSASLVALILAGDIIKYKRKRMTKKQFTKNLICEVVGAFSGFIGQSYGMSQKSYGLGSFYGLVCGMLAYTVTKSIANIVIKDDIYEMIEFLDRQVSKIILENKEYGVEVSQKNDFISFMANNNHLSNEFFEQLIKESNKEEFVKRLVLSQILLFKNPQDPVKKRSIMSRFLGWLDV